ncbi:hypothetical protein R1flu_022053 [Riccia fluitans]|uniref:Uncharacterized protein n=1 Tax=Riccia fluitans TaxID=41844 RepID=A0ABD1ZR28_9MARC
MANFRRTHPEFEERAPSDQERELYERARKAADEAVREGNAQLKAAMAAAGAPMPCILGNATHMDPFSLRFSSSRLEAAYRLSATSSSDTSDCILVILQIALCLRDIYPVIRVGRTDSSLEEKAFSLLELWVAVSCVAVLALQRILPQWYRRNRGATLKYIVMLVWTLENLKLFLDTDEMTSTVVEVSLMNIYMSFLHRVPFLPHVKCRSIACGTQLAVVFSKSFSTKQTSSIILVTFASNAIGLVFSYLIDRSARRQYLKSLPSLLVEEIESTAPRPELRFSYRNSLSQQFRSIFYPKHLECPDSATGNKAIKYEQIMAPRRALGGFAGGFGGVSSLKCSAPISVSPVSSSRSLSERSSDSSSGDWTGAVATESGISSGEGLASRNYSSGYRRRESPILDTNVSTSACGQVGMEDSPLRYIRSSGRRDVSGKWEQFY